MRIKKILKTTKRSLTSPKRVFTIFGDVGPSCSSDYKLRIFILNNKFYKHSGADGIQLVSSQAPIGIGIFSDPVISTSSCSLWRLSGFGTWVHRESRNPRCIGSRIRIENAHACTFPFFFAHSAVFDTGRSQNDYNNYFIRRGSGPLCLPILKVITRCLHCPSGTALWVSLLPQPRYTVYNPLHHESPLYVYASACPLCKLTLSRYSSLSYNALSWMYPCSSSLCTNANMSHII